MRLQMGAGGALAAPGEALVVDPRFTRTAAVADLYVPIRPGTDIAWLGGLINYLVSGDKIQHEYVKSFTNAPYLIKEGYGFSDGLFTGYQEAKRDYDRSSWDYELDEQGQVKADETLQHPRCVFQLLKQHYARYTPEMVERITGSPRDKLMTAWQWIAETAPPDKAMTSMYALGWTQHTVGSQNIRRWRGAIAAREYRRGGRRHERAARPFQHPGPDRSRAALEPDPRLSDIAERARAGSRDLYEVTRVQAAAPRPIELLAELQEVLRQLPEVDVGQGGDGGKRLRLRLPAQARRRV